MDSGVFGGMGILSSKSKSKTPFSFLHCRIRINGRTDARTGQMAFHGTGFVRTVMSSPPGAIEFRWKE